MSCITPFYVKVKIPRPGQMRFQAVPCGRCTQCVRRKAAQWVVRLLEEDKVATSAHFITLTYNDDHLPYAGDGYPSLWKPDFQKFIKLLRKYSRYEKVSLGLDTEGVEQFERRSVLRYYAVGEYGSETFRPHYHVILFNLDDPLLLYKHWFRGDIDVGTVSDASLAYVTGYVQKPRTVPAFDSDPREKEFTFISNGIGRSYLSSDNRSYHLAGDDRFYCVLPGGYKVAMPRYYREPLFSDPEGQEIAARFKRLMEGKVSDLEHARLKKFVKKYGSLNGFTRASYDSVRHEIDNDIKRRKIRKGKF